MHAALTAKGLPPPDHKCLLEEKKIDIDAEKERRTWESCCLRTDRQMCQFGVSTFIASIILGFSFVQLIRFDSCESIQPYLSMITFVLGNFCRDVVKSTG